MTIILGNVAFGTNGNDSYLSETGPVSDNGGSHTVYGLNGHDVVYGGGGNDTVYGGNGSDQLFGDSGNDTVYGESGDDRLDGGSGNNALYGGAGNDTFWSDGGNDRYYGGSGFDTLVYSDLTVGAHIDVAAGTGATGDTIFGIEQFIGTQSTDMMVGDYGANWFSGAGGADLLRGGAGNDSLDGGFGNDLLEGGSGADVLNGGVGIDTVTYEHSSAGVSVALDSGIGAGGEAAGDVLSGVENIIGSAHDDYLFGNFTKNVLYGGAGNDWIKGDNDADRLYGGSGVDTVSYSHSSNGVAVDLAAGTAVGGAAQGDVISSFENANGSAKGDSLKGSSVANSLYGGDGNDGLDGRGSDDMLFGGNGADYMVGGTGADSFVYYATAESGPGVGHHDTIQDFQHGVDKIDLSYIDAKVHTAGGQAFDLIGHAAFSAEGQIRYYEDGGKTVIEVNTSGAGGAEMEIVLLGNTVLTDNDFLL